MPFSREAKYAADAVGFHVGGFRIKAARAKESKRHRNPLVLKLFSLLKLQLWIISSVQADNWRLDALDASLEMFVRPCLGTSISCRERLTCLEKQHVLQVCACVA